MILPVLMQCFTLSFSINCKYSSASVPEINPQSAYALHILNNRHEYGPMNRVMKILKPCRKGKLMNTWETMFIQLHHRNRSLITEQQRSEHNPLYDLVSLTPTTETITQTHGYN